MSIKNSVTVVVGGSLTLTRDNLKYDLVQVYNDHQLSVEGLDGGNWKVEGQFLGDAVWRTLESFTGKAETDYLTLKGFLIESFKITLAGMGGAAAPKLHLTSRRSHL